MNPVKRPRRPDSDEMLDPPSPLWSALHDDDEAAVCSLLSRGAASPNEIGWYDGARGPSGPALGYALVWSLGRAVTCLLDAGAYPNATVNGAPVAGWARSPENLRLIVDAGADINGTQVANGRSVLHDLAGHSNAATVLTAIELGADVHHRDAWGHTAVFEAGSRDIASALVEAGADPLATDPTGLQPLYNAAMSGLGDVVETLLQFGCEPLRSSRVNGQNPLTIAIDRGHDAIAQRLRDFSSEQARD